MKKLSLTFVVAACVLAAGCSKKPTAVSFLDRVMTVDEFKNDVAAQKKVLGECQSNPGELRDDPNCVNARQAALAQATKNEIPRF